MSCNSSRDIDVDQCGDGYLLTDGTKPSVDRPKGYIDILRSQQRGQETVHLWRLTEIPWVWRSISTMAASPRRKTRVMNHVGSYQRYMDFTNMSSPPTGTQEELPKEKDGNRALHIRQCEGGTGIFD